MSALGALLDSLPRWVLVAGKGGVGKTTAAAALAVASASREERTLLLSTDPARTLGDALGGLSLTHAPVDVPGRPGLLARQLDAAAARTAFLDRWREVLVTILDRGTYLDNEDITGLLDASMPGADEVMALLALGELSRDEQWQRVLIDTAPTGHTLRLLALPRSFEAVVDLLDTMQGKHRFMVSALMHRYRSDAADEFLETMRAELEGLRRALAASAVVLVARAEQVVAAETVRYAATLAAEGPRPAALVLNALPDVPATDERAALGQLLGAARTHGLSTWCVPVLDPPPNDAAALERWGAALAPFRMDEGDAPVPPPRKSEADGRGDAVAGPQREGQQVSPADLVRPLTIVGGKGGVGKTTVACALAIGVANEKEPVLLVSTDPAPSIADALGVAVADAETPIETVPGLVARQIDAAASFARLRERFAAQVDAVFDAIMGGSIDAAHDRAVLRDLLSLAPPGVDELYALARLGESLAEGRYSRIIVDPAPTGHLLRLLEMPAVALEWSHRLMRLMLKYREAGGLGDAAGEVLAFAKRTRHLGELLRDHRRGGLVVVTLDEPLVRGESVRLVRAVRELGVDVIALFWNRSDGTHAALPAEPPVRQVEGVRRRPPPEGVDALREWTRSWRWTAENG